MKHESSPLIFVHRVFIFTLHYFLNMTDFPQAVSVAQAGEGSRGNALRCIGNTNKVRLSQHP